jgi:hypothetical protein
MGVLDSESLFEKSIAEPLEDARQYKNINLIVGIPFYNEVDTLPLVLRMVADSLVSMKISDKALIICAGDPAGEKALEAVKNMKLQVPHMQFLMLEGGNGRGVMAAGDHYATIDLEVFPGKIKGWCHHQPDIYHMAAHIQQPLQHHFVQPFRAETVVPANQHLIRSVLLNIGSKSLPDEPYSSIC